MQNSFSSSSSQITSNQAQSSKNNNHQFYGRNYSNNNNQTAITTSTINNNQDSQKCEYYQIKGLNCIFNTATSIIKSNNNNKHCSPYLVLKFNNNNLIISSVCKILSNSAFWNDCISFHIDSDQHEKILQVEIHNYTLYDNEKELKDTMTSIDDKDFLGTAIINIDDLISNNNNNNSDGRTSGQIINNTLSNSNDNSIFIGSTKVIGKDGMNIASLQFNILKETHTNKNINNYTNNTITHNNINNIYSSTNSNSNSQSSSSCSSYGQPTTQDSLKYMNNKLTDSVNVKGISTLLQQQQALHPTILHSNSYYQPKSTYIRRDTLAEEQDNSQQQYRSIKNTFNPLIDINSFSFNHNNINNNPNTFQQNAVKSSISSSDNESFSAHSQYSNLNIECFQTPRYLNNIAKNRENDDNQQQQQQQQQYYSSTENSQVSGYNKLNTSQQQHTQNIIDLNNVSPLRDIYNKITISSDLTTSSNHKPQQQYIGLPNNAQFPQTIQQYPLFYANIVQQQQQLQHQQQPIQQIQQLHQPQQQIGLINIQNIIPQQIQLNGGQTTTTAATCSSTSSQRNGYQLGQCNFSQAAIQVLGQNSINIITNNNNNNNNNLIRTVQSQKTIVNRYPTSNNNNNNSNINNNNNISVSPFNHITTPQQQPCFFQQQQQQSQGISVTNNNNLSSNQPLSTSPGCIQKINVTTTTSSLPRQSISNAATPFKNQRNVQNFYQPF